MKIITPPGAARDLELDINYPINRDRGRSRIGFANRDDQVVFRRGNSPATQLGVSTRVLIGDNDDLAAGGRITHFQAAQSDIEPHRPALIEMELRADLISGFTDRPFQAAGHVAASLRLTALASSTSKSSPRPT
jgi:hypothetical protein